jgi:hypothetical protein
MAQPLPAETLNGSNLQQINIFDVAPKTMDALSKAKALKRFNAHNKRLELQKHNAPKSKTTATTDDSPTKQDKKK